MQTMHFDAVVHDVTTIKIWRVSWWKIVYLLTEVFNANFHDAQTEFNDWAIYGLHKILRIDSSDEVT